MAQGRPSQTLTTEEIERLESFRIAERLTFAKLNETMQNPFSWEVLKRAIGGRPVWELNHGHIVNWIERNLTAASGGPVKSAVSEGDDVNVNAKL